MLKQLKIFITSAAVVSALLYSNQVSAYPVVTDGKKDVLSKMVNAEVTYIQEIAEYYGSKLKINGPIEVTNEDAYYSVTIPDVSLKFMNTDKILHIGTIAANFVQRNDDIWDAKVSIPYLITLNDGKDKIEANINIGKQTFDISWFPQKHLYPQMTTNFQNIQISGVKNKYLNASIGKLYINSFLNLNRDKDWAGYNKATTWNGLATIQLDDLKASLDGGYSVEAKTIKDVVMHKEVSPVKIGINRNKVEQTIAGNEEALTLSDDDYMLDRLKSLLETDREPMHQLLVKGVTIKRSTPSMQTVNTFKLNIAEMKNGYIRLKNGLYNMKGWFEFHDFQSTGFAREYDRLIPSDGKILIDARYLPIASLNKVFTDELSTVVNKDNDTVISRIGNKIATLLKETNSYLHIKEANLQNGDTNMKISGNFVAKPKSAYGYAANFEMSLNGLKDQQNTFRAFGGNPNIDFRTLAYAINMAAIATSNNPQEPGTIDRYKVKIFENGQIEVNGRNFHQ